MSTISIIKCGYVGLNIAKYLSKKNIFNLLLTTHIETNLHILNNYSTNIFLLKRDDKEELKTIIAQSDYIILTLPKYLVHGNEHKYIQYAQNINEAAHELNKPKNLIFTSRDVVYEDRQGQWVDENTEVNPTSFLSKILKQTEDTLLSLNDLNWKVAIFRLSEVYGPEFELSEKLLKKQSDYFYLLEQNNYTNMIHIKDVARAIEFALQKHLTGIYNLSDDDHPILKDLILEISQKLNVKVQIPKPNSHVIQKDNKRVSNYKIKKEGFSFLYPKRQIF